MKCNCLVEINSIQFNYLHCSVAENEDAGDRLAK